MPDARRPPQRRAAPTSSRSRSPGTASPPRAAGLAWRALASWRSCLAARAEPRRGRRPRPRRAAIAEHRGLEARSALDSATRRILGARGPRRGGTCRAQARSARAAQAAPQPRSPGGRVVAPARARPAYRASPGRTNMISGTTQAGETLSMKRTDSAMSSGADHLLGGDMLLDEVGHRRVDERGAERDRLDRRRRRAPCSSLRSSRRRRAWWPSRPTAMPRRACRRSRTC